VREMSPSIARTPGHLFEPLDTIRWTYASAPEGGGAGGTDNPPRGVTFSYYLAAEPEEDISLAILKKEGSVIRTLSSMAEEPFLAPDHPDASPDQESKADLTKNKGMNRTSWDLTHEGATEIPGSTNDAGRMNHGPMVVPGEFIARLTVGGATYDQPFNVLPDPRSEAPLENLRAQNAFALALRDRVSAIAEDAIRIRDIREQLDTHESRLGDKAAAARLLQLGKDAKAALREVDLKLYSPDAEVLYDVLAGREGGAKLYSRYGWLYDLSMDHNGPPTQGMTEVDSELLVLYEEAKAELERIIAEDISQINALASELGIDHVIH